MGIHDVDHDLEVPTVQAFSPFVEVEFVFRKEDTTVDADAWRTLEIWTQNRVYSVDRQWRCTEVADRMTRKPEEKNPLLGAMLVGGQARRGGYFELTHPFPRPGCEAVFARPSGEHMNTSEIDRVVLRVCVLSVPNDRNSANTTWRELSKAGGS